MTESGTLSSVNSPAPGRVMSVSPRRISSATSLTSRNKCKPLARNKGLTWPGKSRPEYTGTIARITLTTTLEFGSCLYKLLLYRQGLSSKERKKMKMKPEDRIGGLNQLNSAQWAEYWALKQRNDRDARRSFWCSLLVAVGIALPLFVYLCLL